MNRSPVRTASIAAVAAALLTVAACAGESTDPPAADDGVTLTLWVTDRVSAPGVSATEEVVQEWERQTGNSVELVENSFFDQMNKIPLAVPAGNGPDVFMLTNNYLGQFQSQQLIAPITLPDATSDLLTPDSLTSFQLGGEYLGVPVAADVNALVYNRALLEQAPATFDDLADVAAELTGDGEFGLLFPIDQYWWDHAFIAGYGGYVFQPTDDGYDVTDVGLANEGAVAAMDYLRDLVADRDLMPADTTADVMAGLFQTGQAAAIITGPTSLPDFDQAGIDYGVAALPALPNGEHPKPFATYTGFSLSSDSAHPEESTQLLAYLAEHLPAALQQASPGNISVRADAAGSADPASAGWLDQLRHSDPLPSVAEMNHVWEPVGAAVTGIMHGELAAETALPEAVTAVGEAIAG